MKNFILGVFGFFILTATALIFAFGIYCFRMHTMSFSVAPDVKILFVGDSQIEVGVDTAFIPGSYNFAKSGDNYINFYFRTKKIIEDNQQIKTLFITASPHSISRYGDDRIFSDFAMQNVFPRNAPFYGAEEWCLFFKRDVVSVLKNLITPFSLAKRAFLDSDKKYMDGVGCPMISEGRNLKKSLKKGIPKEYEFLGDEISMKYLRTTVDFAKKQGVRVIFLNTPTYDSANYFDMEYFRKRVAEQFPDVELWDYATFEVSDDCRQDIGHLNKWGAVVFSKELAARMKREGIISE